MVMKTSYMPDTALGNQIGELLFYKITSSNVCSFVFWQLSYECDTKKLSQGPYAISLFCYTGVGKTQNGKRNETGKNILFFLFWGFSFRSRIFHSYGDVTGEGLQILTYARHSWPLTSDGYLACRTYCDTAHPLLQSSPRTHDTHILPSVWQWSCHYLLFTTQVCCGFDSDIKPFACGSNALTSCATAVVILAKNIYILYFQQSTRFPLAIHIFTIRKQVQLSQIPNNKLLIFCFEPCWLIKQSFKSS